MSDQSPVIGITLGDVNGIGPELVLKAFAETGLQELVTPILFGPNKAIQQYRDLLELSRFHYGTISHPSKVHHNKVNLVDTTPDFDQAEPGVPSPKTGRAAFQALEAAVKSLQEGHIEALVTLPIDKSTIQGEGFKFPGHTEYLAQRFEAKEHLMLMVHEDLRIAVVTGHIPLRDVAGKLSNEAIYRKVALLYDTLRFDFSIARPKIAVLGLNPHAGDGGLLGKEDNDIIKKVVDRMLADKKHVYGPYPADSFFVDTYRKFDAVLAMYHDQGLLPFKTLSEAKGVNFTAGLPIVRTSPDHGTAYDIAGHNKADITSFLNSIYTAIDIVRSRRLNLDLKENAMVPPRVSQFYQGEDVVLKEEQAV
jgi:4-hydroxythreonine-4-phosphate dehydrogenase